MKWTVISLAAIAEKDESFRDAGDALWPERFDLDALDQLRKGDPVVWESSYQQHPTVGGGNWFDRSWIQLYKEIKPSTMNLYMIVDPALNRSKRSDFTCILIVGGGSDRNYYWVDCVRSRMDPAERAATIFQMHRKWRPLHVGYEEFGLQSDIAHLREKQERENYRFPILELGRKGIWHNLSKAERIRTLIPLARLGRIWLPDPMWGGRNPNDRDLVTYFLDREWEAYPAVDFDDMLDALSRINDPDMRIVFPSTERVDMMSYHRPPGTSWMSA